jgi:hypothetical protein
LTVAQENDGDAMLHPDGKDERPVVTVSAVALAPAGTLNATVTVVLLLSGTLLSVLAATAVDTVDAVDTVPPEPDERLTPPWHAPSTRIEHRNRIRFTTVIFPSRIPFRCAEIVSNQTPFPQRTASLSASIHATGGSPCTEKACSNAIGALAGSSSVAWSTGWLLSVVPAFASST